MTRSTVVRADGLWAAVGSVPVVASIAASVLALVAALLAVEGRDSADRASTTSPVRPGGSERNMSITKVASDKKGQTASWSSSAVARADSEPPLTSVEELTHECALLRSRMERRTDEARAFEKQVSSLTTENADLRKQLDETRAALAASEKTLVEHKAQVSGAIEVARVEISELLCVEETLRNKVEELEKANKSLRGDAKLQRQKTAAELRQLANYLVSEADQE